MQLAASLWIALSASFMRPAHPSVPPEVSISAHAGDTVLFVLTGADTQVLANGRARTSGYFLGEAYEAWRSIVDAGYSVEIATPDGTTAPVDPESLDPKYWRAHPQWRAEAIAWTREHPPLQRPLDLDDALARRDRYVGLVVPGGQGVMTDLVHDPRLHALVAGLGQDGRAIGLVCHAPAILGRLPRGHRLVGRRVTSVTGFEEFYIERFVMRGRARERAIGRSLRRLGYRYRHAGPGRPFAIRDGNLVTSQNPFSGDAFARHYLEALASVPRRAAP
jgi:putative intracellular protease/amidase